MVGVFIENKIPVSALGTHRRGLIRPEASIARVSIEEGCYFKSGIIAAHKEYLAPAGQLFHETTHRHIAIIKAPKFFLAFNISLQLRNEVRQPNTVICELFLSGFKVG